MLRMSIGGHKSECYTRTYLVPGNKDRLRRVCSSWPSTELERRLGDGTSRNGGRCKDVRQSYL